MNMIDDRLGALTPAFPHWEKTKDLIEQLLDIMLNYRQSGHPGGSRSKLHALIATLLGGAMRWDIRAPEKRFGDRFVLGAGHTIPMIYTTLAVLNEAMRCGRISWAFAAGAGSPAMPRWKGRPCF
jgi:hypothetical protein